MRRTTNQRLVALCAGLLLLLGALWMRCAWLQVLGAGRLARIGRAQHHVSRTVVAPRGTIYDRNDRILAMSVRVPSVFANPRQMAAKEQAAVRLASVLGRDRGLVSDRLARDKGFVWLARQVDLDVPGQLQPMFRQGVGIIEEPKRLYPHGELLSHLLGYVDVDQHGLEGMELAYNGILQGTPGWFSTERDAKGDLLLGPETIERQPEPGLDMVLTIDSIVQGAAEEALSWGVKKFKAKGGSVIVMDPHTGDILAMANRPGFDANKPARSKPETRRNRAITDLFEPGSIFKIVTAAALLEEKLARPDERVYCEQGNYKTVGRHVLHDHKPHGSLTFHEVIQYSSNIGTAKFAVRLKPDVLYRYIKAFGFGEKTGIEFPGEVRGLIAPPSRWSKLSPYIIPIGQEIASTPIQLAVMTSVIANGGWRVKPRLVSRIQSIDGDVVREYGPRGRERILSDETAELVQQMLVSVVESGTGQLANVQGLTVAGKTGTAQKLEPNGRYSHSRYIASFVGFGPVPDPRFIMVVSIDEPRPIYFGGVVAAPIFKRIVQQLAGYWELTPTAATVARLPSHD